MTLVLFKMKKIWICLVGGLLSAGAANSHAADFRYRYALSNNVPYAWEVTETAYDDWKDVQGIYACTNWSPSIATIGKGITFGQTATDCKQDQERTAHPQRKDQRTGKVEYIPDAAYQQKQTIAATSERDAVGILENWMTFDPTYTSWTDTNSLYGCTSWSPDPAIYSVTTQFTQKSDLCKTDQERIRQDREQEHYTLEIRDSGLPVTEKQTLTKQSATRPYSVLLGSWIDVGAKYACSDWSPDPSTVGKSIAFTQSATDCKLDQKRTRDESYVDHKTGIKNTVTKADETQVLTKQANSRPAIGTQEIWGATDPVYTAWTNTPGKILYSCSNWNPAGSSKSSTATFTQTASDCKTDQTRTRQDREIEENTQEIRNKGSLVTENQTLSSQTATRNYTVSIAAWANNGAVNSCSNWSPDPSTVTIGQSFTQTATDCLQPQNRVRAESYVDHLTGSTVAVSSVTQTQSITATSTRTATGTKETWVAATPTYTAWTNTNALYGCAAWTPAGSSKTVTGTFTQTAADCETDQTRNRQDREQESTTLAYRNKGTPVAETQTLTSQTATRSYTVTLGSWTNSGAKYGCTNWSPAPSTVTIGQSFTQTAADCEQDQTRTRAESYVDHKSGSTVAVTAPAETQTLTAQSNTQTATGTKETWVATTSVYSAWGNTSGVYSCTNWSPAPATVTIGQVYTQTATDCSVNQSRTRQDRQVETTTGAIRNNGSVVTETQTVGGQTSYQSATGTKETWVATTSVYGAWGNTSGAYNCTNWSPSPASVTLNQAFTQTATNCYINQSRTRQDRQVETTTGAIRNNGAVVTETQTIGGQTGYQTAYGTYNPLPSISNFYVSQSPTQHCQIFKNYGALVWSSNAASYTLLTPAGQWLGLGGATSYTSVVAGTYTLYACNSSGSCSTAIATAILVEGGGIACNK
jgi:hypothetical protein